jgi:hypothetical protein
MPVLKASPSLPELNGGGLGRWPENLVDLPALSAAQDDRPPEEQRGRKSSFHSSRAISFHKPFRAADGARSPTSSAYGTIASMYAAAPPSAWSRGGGNAHPLSSSMKSQRRVPRQAPTFNIMVAGGRETGKTSFLRLLLQTCEVSSNASSEQKAAVDRFMQGRVARTKALRSACIEVADHRYGGVLLTVIDTPGLNFLEGRELELERSVSGIIKYLDLQFAETMDEVCLLSIYLLFIA